tara:strand:+ start:722 stop:871 length:150 start_codon:yes stop_codon:yes gene_type:complete
MLAKLGALMPVKDLVLAKVSSKKGALLDWTSLGPALTTKKSVWRVNLIA